MIKIMETKLTRVPFDAEMAKRIQSGEIEGMIVTRDGRSARIVCWDRNNDTYPIVALIPNEDEIEDSLFFTRKGTYYTEGETCDDLMLEIPEYMTFKDGDVIAFGSGSVGIFKEIDLKNGTFFSYATLSGNTLIFYEPAWTLKNSRIATEEEKKKLINELKSSKHERAKKYLKRFLGIEQKKECEFKPFDKVLVRDFETESWHIDLFCRYIIDEDDDTPYEYEGTSGTTWTNCIPYNEQTAHLLGTTDNYEE